MINQISFYDLVCCIKCGTKLYVDSDPGPVETEKSCGNCGWSCLELGGPQDPKTDEGNKKWT